MVAEGTIDVAAKYITLSVTCNKSTTKAATLDCGERIVETLDVKWAPGHVGLVGFRITYNGVAILPWNQPTSFVFGDNERLFYDLGIHVAAPLAIAMVNQDTYRHTLIFTAKLRELKLPGEAAPPLLSLAQIA